MHGFSLDKRPKLGEQRLLGHQIDRASQQVFKVELNTKITGGSCGAIECHKHIHITSIRG